MAYACVCVCARALFWVLQLDIHCHFHSTQCEFHFICRPGWIFTLFIFFLFLRWFCSEEMDHKPLKYTTHIVENVTMLCDMGMDVMWCWTVGWLDCWQLTSFSHVPPLVNSPLAISNMSNVSLNLLPVCAPSDSVLCSFLLYVVQSLQLRIHCPIRCF